MLKGAVELRQQKNNRAARKKGCPVALMPLVWFAQRANQTTTRYAGVSKKLYKKIPLPL